MANMHYTHNVGYVGASVPHAQAAPHSNTFKKMTNLAGSVASVALIAGVGVWGYNLVMRDVSGIPVVRAAEGDMRVRPADPGGQLAQNTGLSVNEVAAAGSAAAPADRLVLAPQPMELAEEDAPMIETVAPVQQPAPLDVAASLDQDAVDVTQALQAGEIDALVSQLTADATPIDTLDNEVQPVLASITAAQVPQVTPTAPVVQGPGPKSSIRPQLRPRTAPAVVIPASTPAATPASAQDLEASALPAGTRLVQLGAFDSPDIARTQWDKMLARFGDYMSGKDRVIQQAQSGGRTFYRLRAHGFTDLSDARRFCSALVAEGADCIPVVTR
ncbi:SPOR domain-containing protein [uncultured Tateyamaria sp.]|uniref:SPOR domain-containing protein n=1 Tax=Tateyamaria sp. 1078 TaxID=3417464 RepID=UPI002625BEB4|nr:SPOR domain-containing protein [uncultured Tateyamaria sp.]